MGGRGSGRKASGSARALVEDALALDIAECVARGVVGAGCRGGAVVHAERGDGQREAVCVEANCNREWGSATLRYSVSGGEVAHGVKLVTTRPRFGGRRWWFRCPVCERRTGALYLHRVAYFRCRSCADLTYGRRRGRPPGAGHGSSEPPKKKTRARARVRADSAHGIAGARARLQTAVHAGHLVLIASCQIVCKTGAEWA